MDFNLNMSVQDGVYWSVMGCWVKRKPWNNSVDGKWHLLSGRTVTWHRNNHPENGKEKGSDVVKKVQITILVSPLYSLKPAAETLWISVEYSFYSWQSILTVYISKRNRFDIVGVWRNNNKPKSVKSFVQTSGLFYYYNYASIFYLTSGSRLSGKGKLVTCKKRLFFSSDR